MQPESSFRRPVHLRGVGGVGHRTKHSVGPFLLVSAVWFAVIGLRHVPIVTFPSLRHDVLATLILCYVAFSVAYGIGFYAMPVRGGDINVRRTATLDGDSTRRAIVLLALLGAFGAALRGADIAFLRGLDFSSGVSVARLENISAVQESGAGARPLAAAGRMLMGGASVAMIAMLLRCEQLPLRIRVMACLSWVFSIALSILEGGRNTIVVNLLLVYATGLVRRRCGLAFLPFKRGVRIVFKTIAVSALGYVLFVFADRFTALGYTDTTVVEAVENTFSVQLAPWIGKLEPGFVKNVVLGLTMTVVYAVHGIDQIGAVVDWLSASSLGMGRYNLDLLVLALSRIGLPIERFPFDSLPNPGLYRTAVGELLLDFGSAGGLVFLAVTGFAVGYLWRAMRRPHPMVFEVGLCFAIVWLMASPLYSIISGFLGVLLAIAVYAVVMLFRSKKLHN